MVKCSRLLCLIQNLTPNQIKGTLSQKSLVLRLDQSAAGVILKNLCLSFRLYVDEKHLLRPKPDGGM